MDLLTYYSDLAVAYPEYITQKQFCEVCGICHKTAYNLTRRGEISYEIVDTPTGRIHHIILTHGLTPVSSRQAVRFLLHGAVWMRNFGASRSVASAFFSLLTSPDRLRRSFYLMHLAKRKTAGRRSHRCTDSMQTGS